MTQQANPSTTTERSQAAVALDNLIRRHLRVSDPTDPEAISQALRERYTDEQQALKNEQSGFPFSQTTEIPVSRESGGVTRLELEQAKDDVERDLTALMSHSGLKDVSAELNGWAVSIRQSIVDGTVAARFALDPRQRDAAMSARRALCGYARLARYVGALTPNISQSYRQLAKSLDEVSAVILVILGEAIANIGHGGARFLLQAPASELQSRRDAVIYALRNLVGTTQESYGPNEWPRGLVAYRQFIQRLEESGHSDLRALFQETFVAKTLDDLLHWSTSGTGEDLRALGSMSHVTLEKFRRLVLLAARLVDPEAPALAAYLSAIQLFLDAFEHGSSGARLLHIARPPVLFYGLYGLGELDAPTRRLVDLIGTRGRLANELDCYLGCDCSDEQVRCQILLDKVLYDIDRAIDLYALGSTKTQEPEHRAGAYGVLIDLLIDPPDEHANWLDGKRIPDCDLPNTDTLPGCRDMTCFDGRAALQSTLNEIRDILWWRPSAGLVIECDGGEVPTFPWSLIKVTSINGAASTVDGYSCKNFGELGTEVRRVYETITAVDPNVPIQDFSLGPNAVKTTLLEHIEVCNRMHQELCLQASMEESWVGLLRTMAPSCFRFNGDELRPTKSLLDAALAAVQVDKACQDYKADIPPHFETSLAGISYWRNSEGGYES